MEKFRAGENPKSASYTKKLNELIRVANKIENMKVSGGRLGKNSDSIKLNISKRNYGGGEGGGTFGLEYGTITEGLEYADEISVGIDRYTCDIEGGSSGVDVGIWNDGFGSTSSNDLRRFVPWLEVGQFHPILLYNGTYFFLSNSFMDVGTNVEKSISWNQELGITQAVFA